MADITAERTVELDEPLAKRGTVSFEMTPADTYQTGDTPQRRVRLLEVPGFASLILRQSDMEPVPDPGVLVFQWGFEEVDEAWKGISRQFAELPGGRTYYVQITWDAERKNLDAYVDGNPIQPPGGDAGEWDLENTGSEIVVPENDVQIENLQVDHYYTPVWRAPEIVPEEYRRKTPEMWGLREEADPLDVEDDKGELLYSADMSDPADIADWPAVEGPGEVEVEDGWMHLWSPGDEYHHVLWCPEDFPDRMVAEWEVRFLSGGFLAMVLFAVTGPQGQDIFAEDVPERTTGDFGDYQQLNAYHISYFAGTRMTSNLRKDGYDESRPGDKRFYLMEQGPNAILAGSEKPHQVRLIKDGPHIQLQVDGEVYVDHTDEGGERFGPRYEGGKIGFRQMSPTQGFYRNLRVWELDR